MFTLAKKNIIVTGGTKGIGRAVAEECVAAGASVLITARTESDLVAFTQLLSARAVHGQRVFGLAVDSADKDSAATIVAAARTHFDSVGNSTHP